MRFFLSLLILSSAAVFGQSERSLLEREPQGWTDILPDAKLSGWTRLPIKPDPLAPASQWRVENGLLICEGDRGHDWLRYDKPLENFIWHVEFRYSPLPGNPRYNSGIFIRTAADYYSHWFQLQIGGGQGGYFFGVAPDGRRFNLSPQTPGQEAVKAAGEWNTVEITAQGPVVTAWVNGKVLCEYRYLPVQKGHLGLEGEGYRIEFRNLKVKPLPSI